MTEYINMWKNYANFSGRTTVRGYWMAFLIYFITNIIVMWIITPLIGGTAETVIDLLWALAHLLPVLAIQIRRLRDAGKHWAYIFINLIPFVGFILYIIALCKPSIADDGVPVV